MVLRILGYGSDYVNVINFAPLRHLILAQRQLDMAGCYKMFFSSTCSVTWPPFLYWSAACVNSLAPRRVGLLECALLGLVIVRPDSASIWWSCIFIRIMLFPHSWMYYTATTRFTMRSLSERFRSALPCMSAIWKFSVCVYSLKRWPRIYFRINRRTFMPLYT